MQYERTLIQISMSKNRQSDSTGRRKIQNHLDEEDAGPSKESFNRSVSKTDNKFHSLPDIQQETGTDIGTNPNQVEAATDMPKDDFIDRFFRGVVSFGAAVFSSAVLAGFLDIATGWDINFGSLPMIAITAVLFFLWYPILTWLGFFRDS